MTTLYKPIIVSRHKNIIYFLWNVPKCFEIFILDKERIDTCHIAAY